MTITRRLAAAVVGVSMLVCLEAGARAAEQ